MIFALKVVLCPVTSVLGLSVVRLESRHTLHFRTCPHLVGKVLVVAPDSHVELAEFHSISASSAFRVFEPSCCGAQQQQWLQVRTGSVVLRRMTVYTEQFMGEAPAKTLFQESCL